MKKFKLSENIDPNKIFIINRSELEGRIDPNFYKTVNKNIVNKIKKNNFYTIKDIVRFSSETWDQKSIFDSEFPYIEISNIDLSDGTIKDVKLIGVKEAPSRAKMIVRKNDIIISTTRPTRGAISIQKNSSIQIASTGFSVIREINEKLFLREALFHILRLSFVSIQMGQRSSGGNYPAITQEELGRIVIPAISLSIQEKINNIYNKAYSEKQQKEAEAQRLLDSIDNYLLGELGITLPKEEELLPQNTDKNNSYNLDNDNPLVKKGRLFLTNLSEVTGKRIDPDYNKIYYINLLNAIKFVNNKPLKDLTSLIDYGLMPTQDYANSMEEGIPFIRVTNILNTGYIDMSDIKYIPFDTPRIENKLVKENDILMVQCGSTTGKVAIVPKQFENYLANSFSFIIRSNNKILQEYLFYILNSSIIQKQIKRSQNIVSVRPNTSKPAVENLLVPLPPLEKQNEIATHISQIRSKANVLMQQGKEILEQAKQEVERMILGN